MTPGIRLLLGQATALGPGRARLLEAIGQTGSISAAARAMGLSYRRAWAMVEGVNACFRQELVTTATGGRGGGGASLTPFGAEVLRRYRAMEAKAAASVAEDLEAFARMLKDES